MECIMTKERSILLLTLWRQLLSCGYSCRASCARAVICNSWHPGTLMPRAKRQCPDVKNYIWLLCLTRSGTGCFIWQQLAWRQRVNMGCWVDYPVGQTQTGSWVTLHRQRPIISSDKHDNINNNSEDDRSVIAGNIKTMHNSSWKCTDTGNGHRSIKCSRFVIYRS